MASLVWLLLRTGTKPSRAGYPCQRMAAANASAWLGAAVIPALMLRLRPALQGLSRAARVLIPTVLVASFAALLVFNAGPLQLGGSVRLAGWGGATSESTPPLDSPVPTGSTPFLPLELQERSPGPPTYSDIVAVQGTSGADDGFTVLVHAMEEAGIPFYQTPESPSGIVGVSDVVILKVNAQWNERGGTNTDLIASITTAVLAHPSGFSGEVVIADNGQAQYGSRGTGGSLGWERNNARDRDQSMERVAASFGTRRVSTYLWDTITTTRVDEYSIGDDRDGYVLSDTPDPETGILVSYPKFQTAAGTRVSFARGVWDGRSYDSDRLTVINVPVLKSHSIYDVTGAVKHYMGVVSDKLTSHNAHRSVATGGMGTQMVETRVPDLNIIDAIWVNARPGRGPRTAYGDASYTGVIAAGRDPVALDVWATTHVLSPAAEHLGLDTDGFGLDSRGRRSFSTWLVLSMEELRRGGVNATMDLSTVNVAVRRLPVSSDAPGRR